MSEEHEIDGERVVRWISKYEDSRLPRLQGQVFADADQVWRIDLVNGSLLTLACDDPVSRKVVHYRFLGGGTVYVDAESDIPGQIEAETLPFERRVEEARVRLNQLRLCGSVRLADTEAVSLLDIVSPWITKRQLPSLKQLHQACEYFERSVPATKQACDLVGDWLSAVMASPVRAIEEASFRIQYCALLRAAGRPGDALAATDVLADARGWTSGENQRAILLTIRAVALMDLYERAGVRGERGALAEARRRLGNAWKIQGPNEHLAMAYRRLDALEKNSPEE